MVRKAFFFLLATAVVGIAGCDLLPGDLLPGGDKDGVNLKQGAVFSMSNARDGNEIAAFSRAKDGTLTLVGRFSTGGTGSGIFEDTANGLVLGNAQGESSPNNLTGASDLLFATNAGSNTITVFRVKKNKLERVEVQESGGEKPVSVTVNGGLVYVLNSGEFEDDLFDADGNVIAQNCTTGDSPSITGFRVSHSGQLTPIPNSTRQLSGDPYSGCAQVSFSPDGKVLVVTERFAVDPPSDNNQAPPGDEGLIVTFRVNSDGTLGDKQLIDATGQGPFGFTFSKQGNLLTAEQFDGPAGPMLGAAAAYSVGSDGSLTATSGSIGNGGTDSCWFVLTDDGKFGFVASFFDPTPRLSSYAVTPQGGLSLIDGDAAIPEQGAADLALSRDSKFLYNINAFTGMVTAYRIGHDGSLTQIQSVRAHPPSDMAGRLGLAAI
ncbi:MAG: lactonase family protein [Rhodothermales bacterium]